MKSGLEDRNNLNIPNAQAILVDVSMKSGLEDRNNITMVVSRSPDVFKSQ